jgi:hypothetical protein
MRATGSFRAAFETLDFLRTQVAVHFRIDSDQELFEEGQSNIQQLLRIRDSRTIFYVAYFGGTFKSLDEPTSFTSHSS